MNRKLAAILAAITLMFVLGACKHSGVAVTEKAQAVDIDIDAPADLAEGQTGTVRVKVRNVGFNNLANTIIQVEFPSELSVMSEDHGRGMMVVSGVAPNGNVLYQYDVGDIEITQDSTASFQVRARFGTRDRTGDIKALVWNEDLPGQRLIETKAITLRR